MKCFHGTTLENYNLIMSGSKQKNGSVWDISEDDNCLYVFPLDKFIKSNDIEDEDIDDIMCQAITDTLDQAEITASVIPTNQLVVLELDISEDLLQDDYSCPHMEDSASFIELDEFNISMIQKVYKSTNYSRERRVFTISNFLNRPYYRIDLIEDYLIELAKSLQEYYIELPEIDYIEETINV